MAEKKNDATWVEIDPASLSAEQQDGYAEYKNAYATMKQFRQEFEASMAQGVPEGQRMIFGYNFGKLSVAIVADDRKPKASKPKQSLAEFLASQQAAGLRT